MNTPAPNDHPYALELRDVTLQFGNDRPVLENLDFKVRSGETRVVLGRSGAGKSTILRLALGLIRPNRGRVFVFGTDITDLPERDLKALRHGMGIVFQGGALFDSITVAHNVGFCLLENHHMSLADAEPMIRERLDYVELGDAYDMMPSELSGGMTKRAAVARAVMCEPGLMLYDEATSGLDPIATRRMNRLINRLRDDLRVTSVVVTHILRDATAVADSFSMLHDGRIIFEGTMEAMRREPHPLVQSFISSEDV